MKLEKIRAYVNYLLLHRKYNRRKSDKDFVSAQFFQEMGYKPNFDNPQTYAEKVNYLKITNHDPLLTELADKNKAKKYIETKLGQNFVAQTYAKWEKAKDISIDNLPSRFVLKTVHDCGGAVICQDKRTFDLKKAKKFLAKHQKNNYYYYCREWPYKNIGPIIIAEQFLDDSLSDWSIAEAERNDPSRKNPESITLISKTLFDEFKEFSFARFYFSGKKEDFKLYFPFTLRRIMQNFLFEKNGFSFYRVSHPTKSVFLIIGPSFNGIAELLSTKNSTEKFGTAHKPMVDYKFYCFDGVPKYFMFSIGEYGHHNSNHKFSCDGSSIDTLFKKETTLPLGQIDIPFNYLDMLECAKILSTNFPFIRVDMYNLRGRIFVGELTFYSNGGYIKVYSHDYDREIASWIDLKKYGFIKN